MMIRNLKKKICSKKGFSFVWTCVIMLIMLTLITIVFEQYRLTIAARTVREKFQDVMIAEAAENYRLMTNTLRDGYAGSQRRDFSAGNGWKYVTETSKERIISEMNAALSAGEHSQIVVKDIVFNVRVPASSVDETSYWYMTSGKVSVTLPAVFGADDSVVNLDVEVEAKWRGEF